MEFVGKAACQTRIRLEEGIHLILITGSNHHELTTIVLHPLHQRIDGFLTILVSTFAEGVSLVDEEDTANSLIADLINDLRRLTHILADQCGTTYLQNTGCRQDVHRLKNLTHLPRKACLARSRITCQHEVH